MAHMNMTVARGVTPLCRGSGICKTFLSWQIRASSNEVTLKSSYRWEYTKMGLNSGLPWHPEPTQMSQVSLHDAPWPRQSSSDARYEVTCELPPNKAWKGARSHPPPPSFNELERTLGFGL